MYKVKPSNTIQKAIKSKKKLLEKADLFDFALKLNNKMYLHVGYSKFSKVQTVGILIVGEDGEVIAREEAIQPAYMFNQYNSYISDVIEVMIPETRKSMKPYENVISELEMLVDEQSPEFAQRTLENYRKVVDIRENQGEVVLKIRDIQNMILDKTGYFTNDELKVIRELCESFTVGQFTIARTFLGSIEEVKKTIKWLSELNNGHGKLVKLLEESVAEKAMNILRKAHKVHQVDYEGNAVQYPKGEAEAAEKWLEVYRDMIERSSEKNILSVLRN